MKVIIVGQGAIGVLYYALLQKNTSLCVSILPSKRIKHFPSQLLFKDTKQVTQKIPLKISSHQDISVCDLVICCVKSYQIPQALRDIAPFIPTKANLILCHNGMGGLTNLPEKIIHHPNTFTMLTTHGCKRISDFNIEHTGIGRTDIGFSKHLIKNETPNFLGILQAVLPECYWQDNIVHMQWTKLAINCVINPLTALHKLKNGAITQTQFNPDIDEILKEVCDVAQHENIALPLISLKETVIDVAQKTALNNSSMLSDVLAGRRTEVDAINGYIHHLGEKLSISTPKNTQLWQAILQIESKQLKGGKL